MLLRTILFSILVSLTLLASHPVLSAQSNLVEHWERRAERVQSQEPHWATPLITNTPVLDQSLRADFQHATEKASATVWNLDAGKGAKVIVAPRTEVDVNFVPYFIHSSGVHNGFGDASFALKFRVFARDPAHGNTLITAILQAAVPTGTYTNGARNATVTPLLGGGKGWGAFDVISTLGGTLPTQGTKTAGRTIAWNSAGQYRASPHWYLELENNASFVKGGTSDGQVGNYLTPGLISRWRNTSRRGLTLGAGMQFATSRTHTLDHNLVLSVRVHF